MDHKFAAGQLHLLHAGHILVLTIWIQNVLTDLLVLMKDEQALEDFKTIKKGEDNYFVRQLEGRKKYDQLSLSQVVKNLYELDPGLEVQYKDDFLYLEGIRNFLAHGRYSLKRPSVFYQPDRGKKRNDDLIKALMEENYVPLKDIDKLPMIWKPDMYRDTHDRLMNFDKIIFAYIAEKLGLGVDINRLK